jgi:hypothetical protein
MKFQGHSGASFGMTMRVMELIAKKGWDAYCMTIRAHRFRIAWEMENGHSDKGEPIFSSRAQAEDFIKYQREHDMEQGWRINYWVERV